MTYGLLRAFHGRVVCSPRVRDERERKIGKRDAKTEAMIFHNLILESTSQHFSVLYLEGSHESSLHSRGRHYTGVGTRKQGSLEAISEVALNPTRGVRETQYYLSAGSKVHQTERGHRGS